MQLDALEIPVWYSLPESAEVSMEHFDLERATEQYEYDEELRAEKTAKVEEVYQEILYLNQLCHNIMGEDSLALVRHCFNISRERHEQIRANI